MTNDELLALNGKILCGEAGQPLQVRDIKIGEGVKKLEDGSFPYEIQVWFDGAAILTDPNDPSKGSDPLPNGESLSGCERLDVEREDKLPFYKKLNEFFALKDPLVDQEDEWIRLAAGTENSVYDEIVGKDCYVRLAVKPAQNPDKYPPTVYYNLFRLKKSETFDQDKVDDIKAKLAARKAKKKAAEEVVF
jgi:hypothetical protein